MEVYTLDPLLRRREIIDQFKSLIWTDRFNKLGDFEIEVVRTPGLEKILVEGTQLALNESDRIMEIETVQKTDTIKVAGRSSEKIMLDRPSFNHKGPLDNEFNDKWPLSETPGNIARELWNFSVAFAYNDPNNQLPLLEVGTRYPADTMLEPDFIIDVELTPDNLYNHLLSICEPYDLGFRLVRNMDAGQLFFDIYAGVDRTTDQTVYEAVVFSQGLDNLHSITELRSSQNYKNMAAVYSKLGYAEVVADGVDPFTDGWDRRFITIVDTSVTAENPDIPAALERVGKEALAANQRFMGFDGEISAHSQYKYGLHYNMGDLVEMRTAESGTNKMRVTEQIFVSDAEGERAYPTFTLYSFTEPGAWKDWRYNKAWNEMESTEFWNNQP